MNSWKSSVNGVRLAVARSTWCALTTATGGRVPRLAKASAASPPLPPETIVSEGHLGPRYLAYLATLALLVGLFERWDLLAGSQVDQA